MKINRLTEATLDLPTQERKMRDWHNGVRNQNLNMSDDKLKMNYDICVQNGYTVEANTLLNIAVSRQLPWALRISQSKQAQQAAQQQNTQQNKYTFSEGDFSITDAQIIKDNKNDMVKLMSELLNSPSARLTVQATQADIDRIFVRAIILALAIKENNVATALKDAVIKNMSLQELKDIINATIADQKIVDRLTKIRNSLNTVSSSPTLNKVLNNNKTDITVNAQPGAAMYRLVTYNKDYTPPARQYLLIRKLDHATNKYHVGIEGSPRATGDWAEPVFDSIQQAENFAKNVITLNTKRNVANFKYSIVSKPFDNTNSIKQCTLVDTILGPAYIQNVSSYKESLSKISEELEADTQIEEDIEKHDELNPKLWNEDHTLKPEVKEKIMQIVEDFCDWLNEDEIKFKLDDVRLTGSNTSFNWTKNSDLDVHLLFDLSIYTDEEKQEMAEVLYDYARKIWNTNRTITFYDIPVELYVETNYEK